MDEVLFRSTQRFDALQVRFGMASQNAFDIIEQYSASGRELVLQAINSPRSEHIQHAFREFIDFVREHMEKAKEATLEIVNPAALYAQVAQIFKNELARNNAFYLCMGLTIGGVGGAILGVYFATPVIPPNVMKAVVAISHRGIDCVTLSNSVPAPHRIRRNSDVLIRVKAACLQRVDEKISCGYARILRRVLSNSKSLNGFPVVLGRSCAGVVEAVGENQRLEIGEEVWVVSPHYGPGLASELALVPQDMVSRKPKIIGFEGAASLPYSGSIALMALQKAKLDETSTLNKRVFIQGGCSPVGCVLCQLLHLWGARLTITCATRAMPVAKALGAEEVIVTTGSVDDLSPIVSSHVLKELSIQEPFDVIFITIDTDLRMIDYQKFLTGNGIIIETIEPELRSDNFGFFLQYFFSAWIKMKYYLKIVLGQNLRDIDGSNLCYLTLDKLCALVDSSQLQTVVDKVFIPHDTELAIAHTCSEEAIGNTVITFR